jgi:metal-sulfur cluster biosynthetic enzyme
MPRKKSGADPETNPVISLLSQTLLPEIRSSIFDQELVKEITQLPGEKRQRVQVSA